MTEFTGSEAADATEVPRDATAWWSWRDTTPGTPAGAPTPDTPLSGAPTPRVGPTPSNTGFGDEPSVVWPTVEPPTASPPPTGAPPTGLPPTGAARSGDTLRRRPWLGIAAVAVVAALVGGVIGGWLTKSSTPTSSLTIEQSQIRPAGLFIGNVTSIPKLVRAVSPAVVSIDVQSPSGEDQGTGMIITHNGYVVTNNHVIAAAANGGVITVTRTGTSTVLNATLLGTNTTDDVALLKIQGATNLPTITFGSSRLLQVGDGVVAIGNALGLAAGTPTVTQGIVSALGRTVTAGNAASNTTETLHNMIQTDAAINPGNSGGPLLDSNGHVIGMNTAVAGTTADGSNSQNIGFAIPSSTIEQLLPTLNHPTHPATVAKGSYLGVFIVTVNQGQRHGLSLASGAYVQRVVTGYPAAKAGIRAGDVIVSIKGTLITGTKDVATVLAGIKPGSTIPVGIVRGSQHLTFQVTVTAHPAT
ncbi:MAG TPA: trypsin-like peptidase domain-containing protein [Acidimicrobiales bacterium]|jgi:putative serine protease PepD|nr:trypsin-like peptidase domain-containing protein [Acidimicrobiales bacterium]